MPYIPTGFETLPDILYRPLLHLQPLQYFEYGAYYAKQQKYELALRYLDLVAEPIVNPDHLPVKKEPIRGVVEKTLKKKIEICCKVWMFEKAREELEALRKLTGKPLKRLEQRVDNAWWSAAVEQLIQDEEEATKRSGKRKSSPKNQPGCRWSQVSLQGEEVIETVKKGQKGKIEGHKYNLVEKTGALQQNAQDGEVKRQNKVPQGKDLVHKEVKNDGKKPIDGRRFAGKSSAGELCMGNMDDYYESGEDEEVVCPEQDPSDDEVECKKAYKLFNGRRA